MRLSRRSLICSTLGAVGFSPWASAALAARSARSLSILNLHTGESLAATYWEAGAYVPDALAALNHVLRDFRTGEVQPIAPGLLDMVTLLQGELGPGRTVQVISGYRSPITNAALRTRSGGVASQSLHMKGEAMDIRLAGVQLSDLRDAALALRVGGVGFYPRSNFVHVDVGRVRRWQGA